jgi:hypothetical protein
METPTAMYHVDFPDGRVFEADEIEKLIKQGWVDSPAKLIKEEKADERPNRKGKK